MNFPYHTESISQHVHHFKPIKVVGKKLISFCERGMGGTPFAENSAKIINLIFEPVPNVFFVESISIKTRLSSIVSQPIKVVVVVVVVIVVTVKLSWG